MSANDPILKVERVSMKFGGLIAVNDLSMEARRGEITALIGPNGAGKTTVFNCLTGFYKPTEGMITMTRKNGETFLLERMPDHEITKRAKVARTFQNIRLFSGMTLLENLLVAQHNTLMKASGFTIMGLLGLGGYGKASAASVDKARFWLDKIGLLDRADDPAGDLPYGAQRRMEIARAMCTEPELLCLDEPAAGLNGRESAELNTLLLDIRKETGTSILLIEHDMSVVMQISDHIVVLEYGQKISDGTPAEVKADPKVIAAYLGVDDDELEQATAEVESVDSNGMVAEGLDAGPDPAHAPQASASMFADPVKDSIIAEDAEVIRVSKGASHAAQAETIRKAKAAKAEAAGKAAKAKAPAASAPAAQSLMSEPVKPKAQAPASRQAKAEAPAAKAKPAASAAKPVAAKAKSAKSAEAKTPAAKPAAKPAEKPAAPKTGKPAKAGAAAKAEAAKPTAAKPSSKPAAAAKPSGKAVTAKAGAPAAKPKLAAKPAAAKPSKPAAKPAADKPAAPKAAVKPVATKAAAKPSAKPAAGAKPSGKAVTAKAEVPAAKAKPAAKPAAAKPAAPKAAAKPAATKEAAKPAATKEAAKPAATKEAAKPAAAKPAAEARLKAPRGGKADDLTRIKGIGPVNNRKLNEHGIFHFDQIADWKKADVVAAEKYLEFDGRIAREDWIGQAKKLAREAAKAAGGKK